MICSTTSGIALKLVHYMPKVVHYLYSQQYILVWRTISTDFGKKNQISIFWYHILRYTSISFYTLLLTYITTTGIAWRLVHYMPKVVHYLYSHQYMLVWRTICTDFGKKKPDSYFSRKWGQYSGSKPGLVANVRLYI